MYNLSPLMTVEFFMLITVEDKSAEFTAFSFKVFSLEFLLNASSASAFSFSFDTASVLAMLIVLFSFSVSAVS